MALTAQNIYDSLERYKTNISDVTDEVFLEWVQFVVNYVWKKVKKIDPLRFIGTQSYTVTTDPQTSALPTNFRDINQTSCGLYLYDTDNSKVTNQKLGITGYGSTEEGFYIEGSNIIFTGITSKAYRMRFMPKAPTITALTDYITVDALVTGAEIVNQEDLEYLVKATDVLYEQWDLNPNSESLADFRFVRALSEMLDSYNRTPQISIIPNQSSDY